MKSALLVRFGNMYNIYGTRSELSVLYGQMDDTFYSDGTSYLSTVKLEEIYGEDKRQTFAKNPTASPSILKDDSLIVTQVYTGKHLYKWQKYRDAMESLKGVKEGFEAAFTSVSEGIKAEILGNRIVTTKPLKRFRFWQKAQQTTSFEDHVKQSLEKSIVSQQKVWKKNARLVGKLHQELAIGQSPFIPAARILAYFENFNFETGYFDTDQAPNTSPLKMPPTLEEEAAHSQPN